MFIWRQNSEIILQFPLNSIQSRGERLFAMSGSEVDLKASGRGNLTRSEVAALSFSFYLVSVAILWSQLGLSRFQDFKIDQSGSAGQLFKDLS